MQGITSSQMILIVASCIGAVIFFIAVSAAIIFFFRRAERGDRIEAAKFTEEADADALQNETIAQNEDFPAR